MEAKEEARQLEAEVIQLAQQSDRVTSELEQLKIEASDVEQKVRYKEAQKARAEQRIAELREQLSYVPIAAQWWRRAKRRRARRSAVGDGRRRCGRRGSGCARAHVFAHAAQRVACADNVLFVDVECHCLPSV